MFPHYTTGNRGKKRSLPVVARLSYDEGLKSPPGREMTHENRKRKPISKSIEPEVIDLTMSSESSSDEDEIQVLEEISAPLQRIFGLVNSGRNHCFINSLMQVLGANLATIVTNCRELLQNDNMMQEMLRILSSPRITSVSTLRWMGAGNEFKNKRQHDVNDWYLYITQNSPCMNILCAYRIRRRCTICGTTSLQVEPQFHIQVPANSEMRPSMQAAIRNRNGCSQRTCHICKKKSDHREEVLIPAECRFLQVVLPIFGKGNVKRNFRLLNVPMRVEAYNETWRLGGAVEHHGNTVYTGHFIGYRTNPDGGFFKCDDEIITKVGSIENRRLYTVLYEKL